jgi:DNA gyrase/topoisomerase IV subunit A
LGPAVPPGPGRGARTTCFFGPDYGKVIRIQTKQVRAVGRATQGVRLINLENGDKVCSVAKAEES